MEEEVQYCKNCKRDISAKNFVIHSAHCERKIQLCDRCSEPVLRSELKKHEDEFHSEEPCSDCGISTEKWQIDKHKETCVKKLVSCEYCELELPLDKLPEHMVICGSRTELCPKCKKHVMIKDLEKHPTKCLRRDPEAITCEYCGLLIDLNQIDMHTVMCGTRTERCFLCNEHVMVLDRDAHFATCQKAQNFDESISCDYCGGSFRHNNFQRHVEMCGLQADKCDRCNTYIQRSEMRLHLSLCKQEQQLRLNFHCKYCGDLFPSGCLEDHTVMCGSQTQKCEKCGIYIEMKNMKTHLDVCQEKKQLSLNFPCNYCGEFFPRENLKDHSAICEYRTQKCEKCDRYIELKNVKIHSNVCQQSTLSKSKTHGNCPVCHQSVPWVEMNIHSTMCARVHYEIDEYERQNRLNENALRKESEASIGKSSGEKKPQLNEETKWCSFCFKNFPYHHFAQHLEVCQERPYNCEKCLKAMAYRTKEEHVSSCHGRKTERHYTNAYMLHDEETEDNKELKRLKKCEFCNIKLPDILFQHHMEECMHQEEKCIHCAENVPIKDMKEHKLLKCNFGAAEQKIFNSRKSVYSEILPEPDKNIDNMWHLEKNVEICPTCNCKIPEERYNKHLLLCYKGKTRCKFCSQEITKNFVREHIRDCPKILEMIEEENNSRRKKKKGEKNEGKSMAKIVFDGLTSLISSKGKNFEKNSTTEGLKETHSWQSNKRQNFERGYMTSIQRPTTVFNEVNELPCEFCNELWPFELLIEHQSGCRPDLVSFPKAHEGNEDLKFATAATTVSQISYTPVLGASPKSTQDDEWKMQSRRNNPKSAQEEDDEWKVQSRRNKPASDRENIDNRIKERNVPQKQQLSTKEKFFYFPSPDSDEVPKNQSSSSNKKRYSQLKKSPETSKKKYPQCTGIPDNTKTKPDKDTGACWGVKTADPKKDQFTSFKFSTSGCNEELQNDSNSWKENDGVPSTDAKIHDGMRKNNSYNLAAEFHSGLDCVKPNLVRETKAVGAERTEKKRLQSREDVDADLSLVKKDFAEISLQKSITFDENNKRKETAKYFETVESSTLNLNMPSIWNTEYNYDYKGKDYTLCDAIENIVYRTLNSNLQDTDYDEKNEETFGSDFVVSINNHQDKEDENSTLSNSDDTFYDADDGGANFVDTVNDNICFSSNTTEEKLNPFDFDNLNLSSRHQRENLSHTSYGDLNVGIRQENDDLNPKDSDLNACYQFLFEKVEQTDEALSYRTTGNCKCGDRECCCETSSIMQNTSYKACSFEDASSSKKYSEPMNVESFVTGTKASTKLTSKKSQLKVSSKKRVAENFSIEKQKWSEWRHSQASDSD